MNSSNERLMHHRDRSHSCRSERLKFRLRDCSKDLALLTDCLDKTKTSLNAIYPHYLAERNHKVDFQVLEQTSLDHFEETFTEKRTNSKVIRGRKLNCDDRFFGNLLWPQSIVTTYQGDILCADSCKHRILAFSKDFLFKYQIGRHGSSSNDEFDEPVDLAFNSIGKLYIADKNNYRIQVYAEIRRKSIAAQPCFRPRTQSLRASVSAEFTYSDSISLNDRPVRLVSSPLASVFACSTQNGFIYVLNLMNQVVYFLKLKTEKCAPFIRNICLNSDGSELIYVRKDDRTGEVSVKLYGLIDANEANNTNYNDEENISPLQTKLKKLDLIKQVSLEREYLPGICLAQIGCVRLGLDLNTLVIFDICNLNLLEYDLASGRFMRIILKAEEYLGNVLAFCFSSDQLHLVTLEVEANQNYRLSNVKEKGANAKFNFYMKSYKIMECKCHKHMVNRRSNFVEKEQTFDFNQNATESFDLFS